MTTDNQSGDGLSPFGIARVETQTIFRTFAAQTLAITFVLFGSLSITEHNAASCLMMIAVGLYALAYALLGSRVFLGMTFAFDQGNGRRLIGE